MQHSELKTLVLDDTDLGVDSILSHADISNFFGPSNVRFETFNVNVNTMHSQF